MSANLDAMSREELKAHAETLRALLKYVHLKSLAITLRECGHIEEALTAEKECDAIYKKLPESERW